MSLRDDIDAEIARLEIRIEHLKRARRELDLGEAASGDESMKYFERRPYDVFRELLLERGGPMLWSEIYDKVVKGGLIHGQKRAGHNPRIARDVNLKLGKLVELPDGYIDLGERHGITPKQAPGGRKAKAKE